MPPRLRRNDLQPPEEPTHCPGYDVQPWYSLGCLQRWTGTSDVCISQGLDDYGAVRVDASSVFFLRGHQVLRLPRP